MSQPTQSDTLEHQLRQQIKKERQIADIKVRKAYKAGFSRARREIVYSHDAEVSFKLAAIAYGQSWTHLRSCALSEGYRNGERYHGYNYRPNTTGSGAYGAFQFMPSTFRGTPFGHLNISRIDVQAFAAAWMFRQGRIGEWTGSGC